MPRRSWVFDLIVIKLRTQKTITYLGQCSVPNFELLAVSGPWLRDYALFEALSQAQGGAPFWHWPAPLRDRDPNALEEARRELAADVDRIEREQYAFYVQWKRLREHARSRDVRLFGDLPFYVGPSSVETWTHRGLFQLTPSGEPAAVGGVPPDYFSELGQLSLIHI